ncbi:PTS sugar transporter subunit IIB [Enorma massiliensis]|uniref:PTS sugar transporter subunit IIB n=1 Tax=Enorma massiliensis TaxID=1472761 RepID=UPI0032099338
MNSTVAMMAERRNNEGALRKDGSIMKKIMLCCNAGMSTSLLVQKMQKEAASRGDDIEIEARPMNEAMEHVAEANIILLGPQIGYAKDDFVKAVDGKVPVEVIPMMDYGRMNAAKILDDAAKLMA